MSTDLKSTSPSKIANLRDEALDAAREYAKNSRAESTWRTYQGAWTVFQDWCAMVSLDALPASSETVAMFIAAQARQGLSPSTLAHRLAAIRLMHLGQGHASPHNTLPVTEVMSGIRKAWNRAGKGAQQKAPILDETIKRMVDQIDDQSLRGLRDRAVLLYGFAGALRRSELVRIDSHHIKAHERGHILTIPYSKGDQAAQGQRIGILAQLGSRYCPVAAIQAWIVTAKITEGAIFRRFYRGDRVSDQRLGDRSVAEIVKEAIYRLKDPTLRYEDFSGHSLRRGFLTSAGQNQADIFKMIAQSRHTRVDTVLRYVEDPKRFDNHAAKDLLQG